MSRAGFGFAVAVAVGVATLLGSSWCHAAETQVLPRGVFVLEAGWVHSTLDSQWSNESTRESLLPDIIRYEPGGGLQGVITARPEVAFEVLLMQLLYGVTDDLTVAVNVPLVRRTTVKTNLGWVQGDYQPQLGRAYSEEDFWQWAESMGQPRPADSWEGNHNTLADMVVAARYRLPKTGWMKRFELTGAVGMQVALPTGRPAAREELISVGTTAFDLHSYGDLELHAAMSRPLWKDSDGLERVGVTVDAFYGWFRPKTFETPRGELNPLLLNYAPYVGDTYTLDPGDWLAGTATLEFAPWAGPTAKGLMYKETPAPGPDLPPLVSVAFAYTHIRTAQSDWQSQSPQWDWDREKPWRPGFKNLFRATGTVSLLRVGVPVQAYAQYRAQDLLPGKNVRPANAFTAGARVFAKFW